MDRHQDLEWFQKNRARLSQEHPARWLVVYQGKLRKVLATGEAAIEFSVTEFGIEKASVFQAIPTDPPDFMWKVDQGLRELDEGKGIPHAEAKERLKKWLVMR